MITKYVIPFLAALSLIFAVTYTVQSRVTWPRTRPLTPPPRSPYPATVAGAGLVEAETENIRIGSNVSGVVVEVMVQVGQRVRAGDPLFRLDDRQHRAELAVREAALASAQAELQRLERMPRPEEIPVREAQVAEAQAQLEDMRYQYERVQQLVKQNAASLDEQVRRRQAYLAAESRLAQARSELALLMAGAWESDKEVARAAVARAQAQVDKARTELERLIVRALVDGEVLQVNVRPGEFVGTPPNQPLIVLGNIAALHVRVDIDEYDIPRYRPGTPAQAMLKGDATRRFPMTFVRVEPYVIPKRSLTNDSTERVDTRVLQVIYKLDPQGERFYVGQQLDVFFEAVEPTTAPASGAAP